MVWIVKGLGFLPSFTTKKCQCRNNMWWGTHACWFKVSWTFNTSHEISASTSKILGASTLSEACGIDDPRGIEIKPPVSLETSAKFPISKLTTLSSYWCTSSFKLNVFIFAISAFDYVYSKTLSFYNNMFLKLVLGLTWDFYNNSTNTND